MCVFVFVCVCEREREILIAAHNRQRNRPQQYVTIVTDGGTDGWPHARTDTNGLMDKVIC